MRTTRKLASAVVLAGAFALPTAASALSISDGSSWESLMLGWSQYLQSDATSVYGAATRDVYVGWLRGLRPASVSAVPEPSAAALFGIGAALVVARTRKR
jgi:hypothetical protein